ncbi:MAG: ATP-binding protein [Oscillibacter sp.]|nr:ATP-binding protein [Oscillibacter sp.]MDD3347718.1 ATP-binding protein [Oscillibacter sp.]
MSYLSFNKYESDLLFKVLSDRSERTSTIVTTNLPFSKWTGHYVPGPQKPLRQRP